LIGDRSGLDVLLGRLNNEVEETKQVIVAAQDRAAHLDMSRRTAEAKAASYQDRIAQLSAELKAGQVATSLSISSPVIVTVLYVRDWRKAKWQLLRKARARKLKTSSVPL
jgi:transcription elongation GreA/GreB family factor